MCVLNGMQVREVSLMHMHLSVDSDRSIGKRKVSATFETGSLPRKSVLSYLLTGTCVDIKNQDKI